MKSRLGKEYTYDTAGTGMTYFLEDGLGNVEGRYGGTVLESMR